MLFKKLLEFLADQNIPDLVLVQKLGLPLCSVVDVLLYTALRRTRHCPRRSLDRTGLDDALDCGSLLEQGRNFRRMVLRINVRRLQGLLKVPLRSCEGDGRNVHIWLERQGVGILCTLIILRIARSQKVAPRTNWY